MGAQIQGLNNPSVIDEVVISFKDKFARKNNF